MARSRDPLLTRARNAARALAWRRGLCEGISYYSDKCCHDIARSVDDEDLLSVRNFGPKCLARFREEYGPRLNPADVAIIDEGDAQVIYLDLNTGALLFATFGGDA